KPAALAQFVHSALFFSSPKRSRSKKILNHHFATAPFYPLYTLLSSYTQTAKGILQSIPGIARLP
ncbi:MAG: hypothetical protein PUB07_03735, partial [Clostridia bacterium]|nr:hypothetical protein [Clostridia bacterium]